ncbi:MAG: Abi family protein [Clostridiales bacterium]|nr:Abi family protein [Clostridiales bacterium]
MIEFKTYEEQIEILKDRRLLIKDQNSAKLFLEKNNYYNVINAYKDIFLDKSQSREQFKSNTYFDYIVEIWRFDKNLNGILFEYVTIVERTIKSKTAYLLSRQYGEQEEKYLNLENFSDRFKREAGVLVKNIKDVINSGIERKNEMICHYYEKYNCIPLWVLVNALTFNRINKFYQYLKEGIQKNIAKELGVLLGKQLYPVNIIKDLKIINLFRNLCAHDQRVFDFNAFSEVSPKHFINRYCGGNKTAVRLFALVCCFYDMLDKYDFNAFLMALNVLWNKAEKELPPDCKNILYEKTGFPENWRTLLNIV